MKPNRLMIGLLVFIAIINPAIPVQNTLAANTYGVILGEGDGSYHLYDNLVVKSPENNLMVKAYSLSKKLGLSYSYDKTTKKLTIKNSDNGKALVFTMGRKNYTYYPGNGGKGSVKTAAYKFYYDSKSKSNVIHMSTLKYIMDYHYYSKVENPYYKQMGYKTLIVYSYRNYSDYDLPIAEEVIDYVNAKTFTSAEELLDAVRLNMIARRTGFTLETNKGVMKEVRTTQTVYELVKAIDKADTAKDADYLTLLVKEFAQKWQSKSTVITYPNGSKEVVEKDNDPASLTIDIKYDTTLVQEKAVDSRIADILKELELKDSTDYEKVKKIHDHIINFASYDTTQKLSSAYDLLFHQASVCEGYALTAYRLFTDAGLECRIISGKGNDENHAWNIVKVDGKWYNIDLTWDDPISSTGKPVLSYKYFLKSEKDFTGHVSNAEFRTKDFMEKYPIALISYE